MNTSQRTDTKAWYQQFWPWLLIGLLLASVMMGLTFAWLATHNADPVIDEDYYQHGLNINKELEQKPAPPEHR